MDNGLRWHHPKRSTTLDKYMSNMFSILLIRFNPKTRIKIIFNTELWIKNGLSGWGEQKTQLALDCRKLHRVD